MDEGRYWCDLCWSNSEKLKAFISPNVSGSLYNKPMKDSALGSSSFNLSPYIVCVLTTGLLTKSEAASGRRAVAGHVFVFDTPPQLLTMNRPDSGLNRMCC